jgi:hypothetical protein
MKLPTDPKIRMQLMIFLGIVSIVIIRLGYYGLSSILAQRAIARAKLHSALGQMDKIDREIRALPALRKSRDDLFLSIQQAAARYILYHEYRNYHLTARETLLPLAASLDITIDIPREGSVLDLPIPDSKVTDRPLKASAKGPKDYAGSISSTFALYSVTLTGRAGFVPLLAFIRRIEDENPYMTVTDLVVDGQAGQPDAHAFTFTVLWPIWKNLELKPKNEDLIQPTQDYANLPENP